MKSGLLVGWLLLAMSAQTLPALLAVAVSAPLVCVFCGRAGEVR